LDFWFENKPSGNPAHDIGEKGRSAAPEFLVTNLIQVLLVPDIFGHGSSSLFPFTWQYIWHHANVNVPM
jgi:hypothetical protein